MVLVDSKGLYMANGLDIGHGIKRRQSIKVDLTIFECMSGDE